MVWTDFNVQLAGLMKLTTLVILTIKLLVVGLGYGKKIVSLSIGTHATFTSLIVQAKVGEKM